MTTKHPTKPEDINPEIKTKPQHSQRLSRTSPKNFNIQSQNLGTKSHGQSWLRRKPMPLNGFLAKNDQSRKILYLVEFDETPRFWYPSVALNTWIDFSSRTVWYRPSECRKNFSFCFSLSLYLIYFLSSPCLLPFIFFFFPFLPFLSTEHPSFCLLPSHFLIFSFLFSYLSHFFILSFSRLFLFLPFLFSISHLDCINRMVQKWGKHPPLSSIATCYHHNFSLNFLIFLFSLFPSFDT